MALRAQRVSGALEKRAPVKVSQLKAFQGRFLTILSKMTKKELLIKKIIHNARLEWKNHTLFNSNWIEWSTTQGVIKRVISKSDEREARA